MLSRSQALQRFLPPSYVHPQSRQNPTRRPLCIIASVWLALTALWKGFLIREGATRGQDELWGPSACQSRLPSPSHSTPGFALFLLHHVPVRLILDCPPAHPRLRILSDKLVEMLTPGLTALGITKTLSPVCWPAQRQS